MSEGELNHLLDLGELLTAPSNVIITNLVQLIFLFLRGERAYELAGLFQKIRRTES